MGTQISRSAKVLLRGVGWAREELNLRPLPCQQNTGNRCATRHSCRSRSTVERKGNAHLACRETLSLAISTLVQVEDMGCGRCSGLAVGEWCLLQK
jgi:hypothetical protein